MKRTLAALLALICASGPPAAWGDPVPPRYADQLLRDPTRPPCWREAATGIQDEGGLRLEILWRKGKKKIATISGVQLGEGEETDEFRLVKIGNDEVTIESAQGQQVLRLSPAVEPFSRAGE